MANKTPSIKEDASNDSFDELEQLRLLVFGQAKVELEQKIVVSHQDLSEKIEAMTHQIQQDMHSMNQNISQQLASLSATLQSSIAEVDSSRENNRIAFEEANNRLLSQLEMAENAGKDDSDILHKRIDDEVSRLEVSADTAMKEIIAQLERVTNDLTSSKTDRKTLAQLLATMASNLDADD